MPFLHLKLVASWVLAQPQGFEQLPKQCVHVHSLAASPAACMAAALFCGLSACGHVRARQVIAMDVVNPDQIDTTLEQVGGCERIKQDLVRRSS